MSSSFLSHHIFVNFFSPSRSLFRSCCWFLNLEIVLLWLYSYMLLTSFFSFYMQFVYMLVCVSVFSMLIC